MNRFLSPALCCLLLSGCVSAPTTVPSQQALKPETLGLAATPEPAIADDWWTAFDDPQLNALVDKALKGSPTLAAAMARVREAQSELSSSRAATYPQLTGDGSEQRERFSKDYIIPPPYGGSTQWVGTVQANLSWSLDVFGKLSSQVDRARATAHASELDATGARLLLAGNVVQAYVALERAYALTDVAADTVKQREGIAALSEGRVRAGLDNVSSQRQAEALLAVERQNLIRAQADRDLAVHQIAALTGRGADGYNIARPHLSVASLSLPRVLPADLLARRADIAAAQARIDAAFSGREVARKSFYPDINLVGVAGWAALGLAPMFSASALQYGGGPAIHLPIFDAGTLRAQYAGATAQLDEAVADYNQSILTAVRQTAGALTGLGQLQDQATEQSRSLRAAGSSFDLATQRYRSGLNPLTNTLDAQSLLIQARRQGAALQADTLSARVMLVMALGGGFVPEPQTVSDNQDMTHEPR